MCRFVGGGDGDGDGDGSGGFGAQEDSLGLCFLGLLSLGECLGQFLRIGYRQMEALWLALRLAGNSKKEVNELRERYLAQALGSVDEQMRARRASDEARLRPGARRGAARTPRSSAPAALPRRSTTCPRPSPPCARPSPSRR
ncbi:hypothetical protein ACH4L7_37665 [Streptomyces anulatus]